MTFSPQWFLTLALVVALPWIRDYSDNATLDVLITLVVYVYIVIMLAASMLIWNFGMTAKRDPSKLKAKITVKPGVTMVPLKMTNLIWLRTIIGISVPLGAFIYFEWTGPAVLYAISVTFLHFGATMIRAAINSQNKVADD